MDYKRIIDRLKQSNSKSLEALYIKAELRNLPSTEKYYSWQITGRKV